MCNVFSLLICFGVLKEATGCELQLIPHVLLSMVHTQRKCTKLSNVQLEENVLKTEIYLQG